MAESQSEQPKILAFASGEKESSVAVTAGDRVLAETCFSDWMQQFADQQSIGKSSALISMIKQAMQTASVEADSLDAIALTHGPGRFTGLRVGVVTARMLCYAWDLPVVAINSLRASAEKLVRENRLDTGAKIWAITDAQRRQVFASEFEVQNDGELKITTAESLFERTEILDQLKAGHHVTGTGAFAFAEEIEKVTGIELPELRVAQCDAVAVARAAVGRIESGDFDDLLKVKPVYFRPSAAEEVRLAKQISG